MFAFLFGSFGDPSHYGTLDTAGSTTSQRTMPGKDVDIDRPKDYEEARKLIV